MVSSGAIRQQVTLSSWTPTDCSRGTSLSMQMVLFYHGETDWRVLQTSDRNSWECIWGLTFQSTELCSISAVSKEANLHPVQPFLRLNRGGGGYCSHCIHTCWTSAARTCFCPQRMRIQLLQHEPGQFKHQTRLSVEGDPNSASGDSCRQVKSFGLVHVVSIHDRELFWGVMCCIICRLYRQN